jgi:type III pantothenate kinase
MAFLGIDIGNTNTKTGYFVKGRLEVTLETASSLGSGEYWPQVEAWLGRDRFGTIEAVGISSVVRDLEASISDGLATIRGVLKEKSPRIFIITNNFPFPLKSAYQPGLLGSDRMLAAVAGSALFGMPVITADIGSAVTLDAVDREGIFRGGVILAGGGFRARALAKFTSLLPEIPVPQSSPALIGTDTVACLRSGIYHGMRAEIQGLVVQIQQALGVSAPVVLGGKGSRLFEQDLPEGWHIEKQLVLKGIYFSCAGSDVRREESG